MTNLITINLYPSDIGYGFTIKKSGTGFYEEIVIVSDVVFGGPAYLAGICKGDQVLEINGLTLQNLPQVAITRLIERTLKRTVHPLQLLILSSSLPEATQTCERSLPSQASFPDHYLLGTATNVSPTHHNNQTIFLKQQNPIFVKNGGKYTYSDPTNISKRHVPQNEQVYQQYNQRVAHWHYLNQQQQQKSKHVNDLYQYTRVGGVHLVANNSNPAVPLPSSNDHAKKPHSVVRLCADGTVMHGLTGIDQCMLRINYFPPPYPVSVVPEDKRNQPDSVAPPQPIPVQPQALATDPSPVFARQNGTAESPSSFKFSNKKRHSISNLVESSDTNQEWIEDASLRRSSSRAGKNRSSGEQFLRNPTTEPVGRSATNPHVTRNIRHLKRYLHIYGSGSPSGGQLSAMSTPTVSETNLESLRGVTPILDRKLENSINLSMSSIAGINKSNSFTDGQQASQHEEVEMTAATDPEPAWIEVQVRSKEHASKRHPEQNFCVRIHAGCLQFRPPDQTQCILSVPLKGVHVNWVDNSPIWPFLARFRNRTASACSSAAILPGGELPTSPEDKPCNCQIYRAETVIKTSPAKLQMADGADQKQQAQSGVESSLRTIMDFKLLNMKFKNAAQAEIALKPLVFLMPTQKKRHHFGLNFFGQKRKLSNSAGQVAPGAMRSKSLGLAGPPGPMPLYLAIGNLGVPFRVMTLQKLTPGPTSKQKSMNQPAFNANQSSKIQQAIRKFKNASANESGGKLDASAYLISSPKPIPPDSAILRTDEKLQPPGARIISGSKSSTVESSSQQSEKVQDHQESVTESALEVEKNQSSVKATAPQPQQPTTVTKPGLACRQSILDETCDNIGPLIRKQSPTRLSLMTLKKLYIFHSAEVSSSSSAEDSTTTSGRKNLLAIAQSESAQSASYVGPSSNNNLNSLASPTCKWGANETVFLQRQQSTSISCYECSSLIHCNKHGQATQESHIGPILFSAGNMPLHKCPRSTVSPFVPFVVELCVTLTEKFGLNCVGIYRMSGAKIAQDFIAGELSKNINEIDVKSDKWNDINAVSCVLKTFLRNLPDSLFPRQMYPEFMAACKIEDRERRLLSIQRLLGIMECYPDHPEFRVHRATLRYLITHLARIAAKQMINRMTAYNLALVFAPNLLQPNEETPELLIADSKFKIWLVETLIKYHDWIFSPDLGLESGCAVPPESTEDLPGAVTVEENVQATVEEAIGRQEGDVRPILQDLLQAALKLPPPLTDLESAEEPGPDTDRPADLEAARLQRLQLEQSQTTDFCHD